MTAVDEAAHRVAVRPSSPAAGVAMATVADGESLAVAEWTEESDSKSDRYLAARLAAAGADVKGIAAATFALAAAVAATAWLAVGVLAEHWLVPGGLPVSARWAWFAAGVLALLGAVIRWVIPLVRYRVNLLYAAREIEREHPELHNDLVNTVLLKARPDAASPTVTRLIERRAAKRLSGVPADGIADRSLPLRLAIALAVLVAAVCIYQLVAPKSMLVSAARLVAPWWRLAPPARVSIGTPELTWRMPPDAAGGDRPAHALRLAGGAASLVRGRQLVVETDIEGLRADERPVLHVTPIRDDGTVDGAAAWQLAPAAGGRSGRMTFVVPDAARGLQHGVDMAITAGDARSERMRVAVVDTPTLLVREVRYEYPPYTRRRPETVAWQGDLRAPEFTKVTLTAESNRPLAAAWIDPGCAGRESDRKRMRVGQHDLSRAGVEFPLHMDADRKGPEFATYRLGFQPLPAGGAPEPDVIDKLEHRVEVIPDLPPEVTIEAPADALRVPPSAPVAIRVRAVDPDYGLARVSVEARVDGVPVRPDARLLDAVHDGPFTGVVELVPDKVGATVGRRLEYRAVAEDGRPGRPNVTASPWRTLQIDAAAPPPPPDPARGAGGRDDRRQPGSGPRDERGPDGGRDAGPEGEQRRDPDDSQAGERRSDDAGQKGGPGPQQPGGQADPNEAGGDEGGRHERGERDGNRPEGGQAGDRRPGATGEGQEGDQGGRQAGGQAQGDQGGDRTGRDQGRGAGADGNGGDSEQRGAAGDGERKAETGAADDEGRRGGDAAGSESGTERGGGRPGGPDGRDGAAPRRALSPEGADDGEAMERILENRTRGAGEGNERAAKPDGDAAGGASADERREAPKGSQPEGSCKGGDGSPCGREGCSSCQGGGAAGGSSGGGAGQGQAQRDSGDASEPGAGKAGGSGGGQPGGKGSGDAATGADPSGGGQSGTGRPGGGTGTGASGADAATGGQRDGEAADGAARGGGRDGGEETGRGGSAGDGSNAAGQGAAAGDRAGTDAARNEASKEAEPSPGGADAAGSAGDAPGADGASNGGADRAQGAGRPADGAADGRPGAGRPGRGEPDAAAGQASPDAQAANGADVGGGGHAGGDRAANAAPPAGDAPPGRDAEWTRQETDHARNAADLAIEHLRDSMNRGRTDVLDELGWTPEQARAFIDRWQAMRRQADSADPVERAEFERAVRSLGLRADGVRTSRDVPADRRGGQTQGRRSRPPAAYREQVEAYLRGTGGG